MGRRDNVARRTAAHEKPRTAALDAERVEVHTPLVLGVEENGAAVGRRGPGGRLCVPGFGEHAAHCRFPVVAHEPHEVGFDLRPESAAVEDVAPVGGVARSEVVGRVALGDPSRRAAVRRDDEHVEIERTVGRAGNVCGEGDLVAVGREVPRARGPVELHVEGGAGEEVGNGAGFEIEPEEVRHHAVGEEVVPVTPQPALARSGLGCVLLEGFEPGLDRREVGVQIRPGGCREGDAAAVGEPLQIRDRDRKVGHPLGLAAFERQHVELCRIVAALRDEGETLAIRAPHGVRVRARVPGEPPGWRLAGCIRHVEIRIALVLIHRIGRDGEGDPVPIGRGYRSSDTLHRPEVVDGHRPLRGCSGRAGGGGDQ